MKRGTRGKQAIKYAYIGLMLFFLYSPIAVLMAYSFNASKSRSTWSGLTLRWYAELIKDNQIMSALTTTLLIAALSSFFAVIIGTAAAVGLHSLRGQRKSTRIKKNVLQSLTNLSISSPEIVLGISLMILFVHCVNALQFGQMGFYTLLLAHISFNVPCVVMSVLPRLRRSNESLYEAALDLGAPPLTAFVKATLPQIKPGIITGAMIAFTLSIDDVVVSFFTAGSSTNLSILIFSMARLGISPKINALSTIMFVVVLLSLYAINAWDSKNRKNNSGNPKGDSKKSRRTRQGNSTNFISNTSNIANTSIANTSNITNTCIANTSIANTSIANTSIANTSIDNTSIANTSNINNSINMVNTSKIDNPINIANTSDINNSSNNKKHNPKEEYLLT